MLGLIIEKIKWNIAKGNCINYTVTVGEGLI